MHICLDIDDTVTYAPDLFSFLVEAIPHATVTVVTFRTDHVEAEQTLREHGVRFDRLITSKDAQLGRGTEQSLVEWKAALVNQLEPDWFFEDMPEVVCRIQPTIKVFMPCDELIRDWLGKAAGGEH